VKGKYGPIRGDQHQNQQGPTLQYKLLSGSGVMKKTPKKKWQKIGFFE